jgi:hypothetical protein
MVINPFFVVLTVLVFGFGIQNIKAQDETLGIELVDSISLEINEVVYFFDFTSFNDTLYINSWETNLLIKVSTVTDELVSGYPTNLSDAVGIHSNYVDSSGILWAFDLDYPRVSRYDRNDNFIDGITVGSQPTSGIEVDGNLLVADREDNNVSIINMETLEVTGSFDIPYLNEESGDFIEMMLYNDSIYMVSTEFNGILRMGTDGSGQTLIPGDISYSGFTIVEDEMFLVSGSVLRTATLDGEITSEVDLTDDGITALQDVYYKNDSLYLITDVGQYIYIYRILSDEAEMLSYDIPGAISVDFVDVDVAVRIEVTMPEGTDLTSLTPVFEISDSATAYNSLTMEEVISGVSTHDFSMLSVPYLIEAENGNQKLFIAIVSEEGIEYESLLLNYDIPGQISNTISHGDEEVHIVMPQGTDLSDLVADFSVSYGAIPVVYSDIQTYQGVVQISGETHNDFTDTLFFTVLNHSQTDLRTYDIIVETETGINNHLSGQHAIDIFPNPVTGNFYVKNKNGNLINSIEFIDLRGRTINAYTHLNNNSCHLNLNELEKGIYIVKVISEDGIYTERISKE